MVIIPTIIAAAIVISGNSIQGDDTNGRISWSTKVSSKASIGDAIGLFQWNQVYWWSTVRQIPTFLACFFLVSFTSSLDVSALGITQSPLHSSYISINLYNIHAGTCDNTQIEMDTGASLDFNHELAVVGWSNFISGILGGMVGSMDRAQSMRAYHATQKNSASRAAGMVVAICELGVVLMPYSLLTVVPKLFIGSFSLRCQIGASVHNHWLLYNGIIGHSWYLMLFVIKPMA
jgi:MFS superfamily sulfate permease-like transporter